MLWVWMYGSEQAHKRAGLRTNLSSVSIPRGLRVTACVKGTPRDPSVYASVLENHSRETQPVGLPVQFESVSPQGKGCCCWVSTPGPFWEHRSRPRLGVWQLCGQLFFDKAWKAEQLAAAIIDGPGGWVLCRGKALGAELHMATSLSAEGAASSVIKCRISLLWDALSSHL